jgi:hypothetical protein
VGGGFSLFFARYLSIDVDALRATSHTGGFFDDVNALFVMVGGDTYSDFFGAGRRKFLNPYVGLRTGYAYVDGKSNMSIAGNFGVELVKTGTVLLDLNARVHAMFGNKEVGAHVGLEPAISIHVAF